MPVTTCDECSACHKWKWEEAFDKFGFGDGGGLVLTGDVAYTLTEAGYKVETNLWAMHNEIITSIEKDGKRLLPYQDDCQYFAHGYSSNIRDYLPKEIIDLLDKEFPD